MKKHFIKSVLSLFLALLTVTPAFADAVSPLTTEQLDFFNLNGINYYTPTASKLGAVGCYIGDITIIGGTVAEKIWTGLTTFMTPEQAAGVMGNMASESGFNPVRHETSKLNAHPGYDIVNGTDVSYGIGLIQWSYGRRVRLMQYVQNTAPHLMQYFLNPEEYGRLGGEAFLQKAGEGVTNQLIQIELQFLKEELTNTASYKGIFNTTSVYDATKFFLEHIEIPKNPYIGAHMGRVTAAEAYYQQYSGTTIVNTSTGSNGTTVSCGASGTFQDLVLRYAWPQYHSPIYVDRMPDYAKIVASRSASGKYVGGSYNGIAGIDCGGFVTTLMQESGFAPNYNSGKGNAASQEQWVKSNGWVLLNGSESSVINTSVLQPGDVAFSGPVNAASHTFVYVGSIAGFGSNIASASANGNGSNNYARAPMAGKESLTYSEYNNPNSTPVRWYRKAESI